MQTPGSRPPPPEAGPPGTVGPPRTDGPPGIEPTGGGSSGGQPSGAPPPQTSGGRRPPRPGLIPVGRLLGVPVYFTASWLLLSLVVVVFSGALFGVRPGGPPPFVLGVSVVACLAVSVLAHEVAHAMVARHYRVGVWSITLELLGGATEMDASAPSPRAEAAIALAGPAASAAIAGVCAALLTLTSPDTVAGALAFQMTGTNAVVAVFNALPGLPLDGGRALRAGVWWCTGDEYRADVVAGRAGQVLALLTFGGAVVYLRLVPDASLLAMGLLVAVAATLWAGASSAVAGAVMRRRLPQVRAGSLARPICIVLTGTPLSEALRLRDAAVPAAGAAVAPARPAAIAVANSAGRIIGLVTARKTASVPPARRPWVDVDAASAALAPDQRIDASATGLEVLSAAQRYPGADLLVTVGEDVVGVVGPADIAAMLRGSAPPVGASAAPGGPIGHQTREPGP